MGKNVISIRSLRHPFGFLIASAVSSSGSVLPYHHPLVSPNASRDKHSLTTAIYVVTIQTNTYSIFVKLRTPLVLLTPAVSLARFASLGAKDGIDLLTPVGCPQRVPSTRPCEFCEKDARFQKGGVIFANSAKMTHVSHG